MKITYITLNPEQSTRAKKIAKSMDVELFKPRHYKKSRSKNRFVRLFQAFLNYSFTMVELLFLQTDVAWVANVPDFLALPFILRRKKYVLDYRSPWGFQVSQVFGLFVGDVCGFMERVAKKNASAITTCSSHLKPLLPKNKPLFVIPNYVERNFGKASISKFEMRKSTNCQKDYVFLHIGKLSKIEGADLLYKGAIRAKKCKFWIVGEGPYLESFSKLKNTIVFGRVPREELPNIINAADCCLCFRHRSPYSFVYNHEGVNKISEYLAFGKPIITMGMAPSPYYNTFLVEDTEPLFWEDHSLPELKKFETFLLKESLP